MEFPCSAQAAARMAEQENKERQEKVNVNGAILQTCREMQNMNNRLAVMEKAQKQDSEQNKKSEKKNLIISLIGAGAAIITVILMILDFLIKYGNKA